MNHIITGIVLLLVGFMGGYLTTNYHTSESEHLTTEEHASSDEHASHHENLIEVPGGVAAPTVALEVLEDPLGGYNAKITTTNFRFAPEHVSTENILGEGHAHIYVDGVKINRMYGPWYSLGNLPEGTHEVRVDLSTNDHGAYALNGEKISSSVTVVVAPKVAFDDAHARMIAVDVKNRTLSPQTVTVSQGDSVHLSVTSDEHGEFHIAGYELVQQIQEGGATDVLFVADKAGRFALELHPQSSAEHDDHMGDDHNAATEDIEIGALVVNPQ